ncbi:MAG: hypothetical protein OSJ83_06030 [Clostridia bacterium]|nr:hypothetical protein [Clostridia bacterium]
MQKSTQALWRAPSHIIYGMDKYHGCNIVESTVKRVTPPSPVKREKPWRGILIKLALAACIILVICAVRYLPAEWLDPVREVLHSVFCYDAFGRKVGLPTSA